MAANELAEPRRQGAGRGWRRISMAWLLPLAAVLFALAVLYQSIIERGPLVSIGFDEAGGVIAGETRIRRNDVVVGTVEAVRLADDLDSVVIEARMDPLVEPFLDANARFWIVNAQVNTTEISGLSTLLSGAYIGVDWDDTQGERVDEFIGLEEAPMTGRGTAGRRVTLAAEEAGYIVVGSPVFFRQIEVGRVERRRLSADATEVLFDVFIEAPYHDYLYPDSRFYGVTGLDGSVGADGISVRVESIAAFFTGGVAFVNPDPVSGLEPVERDGSRFTLYDGRKDALESFFQGEEDERFRYTATFSGSVKGLKRDAPIEYNGLPIGRVAGVSLRIPAQPGTPADAVAVLQLQPRRLGISGAEPDAVLDELERLVDDGLRVQLATGNLLTGSLIVKLVDDDAAPRAALDRNALPYPSLPTTDSNVEAVTKDVEQLISQLSELPLTELVEAATGLLADTRAIVASPEVDALPARLAESLESIASTTARLESAATGLPDLVSSLTAASRNADDVLDGLAPDSEIYIELSATVRELRSAARSIAGFAELLEDNPNAVFTGRR